jgi:hypothetical protein
MLYHCSPPQSKFVSQEDMKAYKGSPGTASRILNVGAYEGKEFASSLGHFLPHRCPWNLFNGVSGELKRQPKFERQIIRFVS